jgi:Caspase domain/Tetratricopeptide repeat
MGRRLGLVIGVNSYQDSAFRPLQYAETDARAIAQWLVNTQGGNWAPSDVQLVQGAYATRELVETLITHLCVNVAGPGDLVFVYFAGHAFLDELHGEGYLALSNTSYQQPNTGIHLPTLAQQSMGRSRAAHVVFMFDYFQTGQFWSRHRQSPYDSRPLLGATILTALQQTNDRLILCSCRGNEIAPESGEKTLGIFAYRMILGFCGPANDPASKQTTLQSLNAFLRSSLGEQQRPQLYGQERTPTVLVGEMPAASAVAPQSGQFPYVPGGQSPAAFSPGVSPAPPSAPRQTATTDMVMNQAFQSAVATAQMSPTTSGLRMLSEVDQHCANLLMQARQWMKLQNPVEAFNTVEQVLHIAPNNVTALVLKGQLLGTVGRFQEALEVVDQVLKKDTNNALAWSMRAALLSNTDQYQMALQAIEHSLELDPNDPETYAIKMSIMGQMAAYQSKGNSKKLLIHPPSKQGGAASFFIDLGLQFLGLMLGIVGVGLPILKPTLPISVALILQSLGLAILCINAARGSFLYGFARFLVTLLISGIAVAILAAGVILGGVTKIGTGRVYVMILNNHALLVPLLFFGTWLAAAAAIPVLISLLSLIAGLIFGVRRKKK